MLFFVVIRIDFSYLRKIIKIHNRATEGLVQHRFGNMAGLVLNSSSVLRLNFCAKLNICASISATSPSREPLPAMPSKKPYKMTRILIITTIFLTIFSCKKSENSENQISESEKTVLLKKISAEIIKPAFGGKIFGDLIVLQRNPSEVYVWTTLQEFYGENNVEKGTGTSLPLKINLNGNPITEDKIVNIEKPRDGSLYGEDINKMFPEIVRKKIENLPNSKILMQMNEDVKNNPIK